MTLSTGTRLGPYEILAPVGAGGMGEVYKARDTRLDRSVAIKVLPPHVREDPQRRERFLREARAVAALEHPHICVLHDIGHHDGTDFLVMEYLEGETLAQRLEKGPLPLDQALYYAIEIAEALDKAHRQGIVHRDLKPGNIMLTRAGTKLLDFGLAKLQRSTPAALASTAQTESADLTDEGKILGTLAYMAPEQLEGKEADARTDIFTFGAVLHEMLTGRKAFEAKSQAALIAAILGIDPPAISSLQPLSPLLVDHVVKRCLAKEPHERWQAASDVMFELRWIVETGSRAEVAAPVEVRPKTWGLLVWTTVAVLVTLVAAALLQLQGSRKAEAVRLSVLPPADTTFALLGSPAPVLSPDGGQLAFVARARDGQQRLWVRSLDSLNAEPLLGTEDARQPFWSPDSRFLGFFSKGKLRIVNVLGGPPQTLCEVSSPRGATWNRDGVIVFSPSATGPLFRVASPGTVFPVTALSEARGETSHRFPYFLPDGRHFLYFAWASTPEQQGVYLGSLDSKETKRLLSAFSGAIYAPPGYLLFVRESTLLAQRFDAGQLELSGEPLPVAEDVLSDPITGAVAFSASAGGALAYRSGAEGGLTQLVWFDRRGAPVERIGRPTLYLSHELAPDGTRVAVERITDTLNTEDIWLLDLPRGTVTRFTFDPQREIAPVWSPDGASLAFASNRDGDFALFRKPSSGAETADRLLEASSKIPSDWSLDGRFIMFYDMNPKTGTDLWALPLSDDRTPIPIATSPFEERQGQFSPDGRWVAYTSDESGRYEVNVQAFPKASGKWQVSTNGGTQPRWRRDGKEIFYVDPQERIVALPVKADRTFQAGLPAVLFRAGIFVGPGARFKPEYSVTADGRRFLVNVLVEEAMSSTVTVVLNWTAPLRR